MNATVAATTFAEEGFGSQQLAMLHRMAEAAPGDTDAPNLEAQRIRLAAHFLIEKNTALTDFAAPVELSAVPGAYAAAHRKLRSSTQEARLTRLRDQQLQANTPQQTAGDKSLNALIADDANREVRATIERDYAGRLEQNVYQAVGQVGAQLSAEQIQWEVANGTLERLPDPLGVPGFTIAAYRAAARVFAGAERRPLSPAELAEGMNLPQGGAGMVISMLVGDGLLTRNVATNTLEPTERIPVRSRGQVILDRLLEPLRH